MRPEEGGFGYQEEFVSRWWWRWWWWMAEELLRPSCLAFLVCGRPFTSAAAAAAAATFVRLYLLAVRLPRRHCRLPPALSAS